MVATSVRDAVSALLAAPDRVAIRQAFLSYPDELLDPDAGELVADAVRTDQIVKGPLQASLLHEMLENGRLNGLTAILNFILPVTPDVAAAVGAYLNAGNWHRVYETLAQQWTLLSGDAADICLENLLVAHRSDRAAQARIFAARSLAQVGRKDGLDGARRWLLAQLSEQLGKRSEARTAVLALQPPETEEWKELLELHIGSIKQLANPFAAVEEMLDVLGRILAEPLIRAPVDIQIAAMLAQGDLYLFRQQDDRQQNRTLALDILGNALSKIDEAVRSKAAMQAHYLVAKAWAQRQTDRAAAFRHALDHLETALSLARSADPSDIALDIRQWQGSCLRQLAARTPNADERKNLVLRAVGTLTEAFGDIVDGARASGLNMELAQAQEALAEFEPWRRQTAVALACDVAETASEARPFDKAYYQCRFGEIALTQRRADPSFDVTAVIETVRNAFSIFEQLSLPQETAWAAELLGDLHMANSQWQDALESYERVMIVGDDLFEQAFTLLGQEVAGQSQTTAAAKIGFCLCKVGRPVEALVRSERSKLRIILGALAQEDMAAADLPEELRQQLSQALDDLRRCEADARDVSELPGQRSEAKIGEALRKATARVNELRAAAQGAWRPLGTFSLSVAGILEVIPPNGVALVPLITPESTAVIILRGGAGEIRPSDVRYLPLTLDDLKDFVARYAIFLEQRRANTNDSAPLLKDLTSRLWDGLMGPLADELRSLALEADAPIMIVGQGGLAVLPLTAAASPARLDHPILLDHALTCVPGLSILAYLRHRTQMAAPASRHVAAVIDPNGNLPYAALEGSLVHRFNGSEAFSMIAGSSATMESVTTSISTATHVHFACHGYFDVRKPWSSGVVMADGSLQAGQIGFRAKPRSLELVVLSACETGVSGFKEAPDEYGGLPAAFLVSGAKAVVSSLWSVNDVSASLLISEFYRLHFGEHRDVQRALRDAQLWLRSVTVEELRSWLGARAKSCRWLSRSDWMTRFRLRRLRRGLAEHEPQKTIFAGPMHWAAFVALTTLAE